MPLTAKQLILNILSVTDSEVSAGALVAIGELFEITGNSIRVALARLLSHGLLERDSPGSYRLTAGAAPIQRHVASWPRLEEGLVFWEGDWAAVYCSRPGDLSRTAVKKRLRALAFLGMRELEPGLWIRPNNLKGGVSKLRLRAMELGLDKRSRVFALGEMDSQSDALARTLWDTDAIEAGYRDHEERLRMSAQTLPHLPLEDAVVESFLVGGLVLNALAFDPLLPPELLAGSSRRSLIEQMQHYNKLGRMRWRDLGLAHGIQVERSTTDVHPG